MLWSRINFWLCHARARISGIKNQLHAVIVIERTNSSEGLKMSGSIGLLLLAACIVGPLEVRSLPGGAPSTACNTLTPNPVSHGADPQTTAVPFSLNLTALANADETGYEYVPGMSYTCMLRYLARLLNVKMAPYYAVVNISIKFAGVKFYVSIVTCLIMQWLDIHFVLTIDHCL